MCCVPQAMSANGATLPTKPSHANHAQLRRSRGNSPPEARSTPQSSAAPSTMRTAVTHHGSTCMTAMRVSAKAEPHTATSVSSSAQFRAV